MWRNVKLSPLAKVKEQACANGFNSRDKDHKLSIWFQIDFSWSNKISTTLLRLGVEVYFMKILNVSFSYASFSHQRLFEASSTDEQWWAYYEASFLIISSWHLTCVRYFPWRTSSSLTQIGERSQNVLGECCSYDLNNQTHHTAGFSRA